MNQPLNARGLALPFLAGLVVREILAPFTGHPFDFEIWVRLGVFMQSGANPYSLLPFIPGVSFSPYPFLTSISYPPLPAFIFALAYRAYEALGSPTPFLYYFLLKQPMIVGDLLSALLLYKMTSDEGDTGRARKVAVAWLFFPFAIIISSIWGALDPLALFLILAAYYAKGKGRLSISAVFLGLSIYLKLMPIIFLPLILMEREVPRTTRVAYAAIAGGIPLLGTFAPFLALGWGFSGLFNAISYQGSFQAFGGLGVFNILSLDDWLQRSLAFLAYAWVPVLFASYAYVYVKRTPLLEASIIVVLAFSLFRGIMPEQWALYPIAFLLLLGGGKFKTYAFSLAASATAFLLANNALLVRFFTPLSSAAFYWDQWFDSASSFSDLRLALMLVFSALFSAEALSILLRKEPFLELKFRLVAHLRPRDLAVPLVYLAAVSVVGGVFDYTATKMITDWALAIQSDVFLGLSWLSLYHIMLVLVFEMMVVVAVLSSRRNLSESLKLFIILTSLNVIASAISLVVYRVLDGSPPVSSTTIYLAGSTYLTERAFVVFAVTIGALSIFFSNEFRATIELGWRYIARMAGGARTESKHANNLSSVA